MFSEVKDCNIREMVDVSGQLKFGHGEHYGLGEVNVDKKGLRQGADFYHWSLVPNKKPNLTASEHWRL
jgi:hypothetical protein